MFDITWRVCGYKHNNFSYSHFLKMSRKNKQVYFEELR